MAMCAKVPPFISFKSLSSGELCVDQSTSPLPHLSWRDTPYAFPLRQTLKHRSRRTFFWKESRAMPDFDAVTRCCFGGASMAQADRGWGKMLLCIDESPSILRYVRALFERSGFIVVTARSAQRGLELAGLLHFDMVLQDFCLPDMNGHNFALEVKRLQGKVM